MQRLSEKVCFVTGGADGIGAATVRLLAEAGATVVFSDVQDEKGAALAAETGASFVHQDVTDEAAWTSILDDIKAKHGRLDVIVNNAGIFRPGTIEEFTTETMREVFDVNVIGVAIGCREAIRVMKENPGGPKGSIINISSIAGLRGVPTGLAYTTSKGAVRLLTKGVAVHCGRAYKNIRCNSVHPGVIDTPMNQAAFDASDDPAAMRDMFASIQPFGRMIEPEELARTIVFLASDDSSATNGAELVVDGGWMAAPNPL